MAAQILNDKNILIIRNGEKNNVSINGIIAYHNDKPFELIKKHIIEKTGKITRSKKRMEILKYGKNIIYYNDLIGMWRESVGHE